MPYPQVQSGGIKAVAIATPGITFDFSVRVISMIPAIPLHNAINTSQIVGWMRALIVVLKWRLKSEKF